LRLIHAESRSVCAPQTTPITEILVNSLITGPTNGARLERINWMGDPSPKGLAQSFGIMVNYLYDLDDIEKNHEAFAENRTVVVSSAVQRLVRAVELVPSAG